VPLAPTLAPPALAQGGTSDAAAWVLPLSAAPSSPVLISAAPPSPVLPISPAAAPTPTPAPPTLHQRTSSAFAAGGQQLTAGGQQLTAAAAPQEPSARTSPRPTAAHNPAPPSAQPARTAHPAVASQPPPQVASPSSQPPTLTHAWASEPAPRDPALWALGWSVTETARLLRDLGHDGSISFHPRPHARPPPPMLEMPGGSTRSAASVWQETLHRASSNESQGMYLVSRAVCCP
jgi:hypothetical protein